LGGTIAAPAILSGRVDAAERVPLTSGLPQGDYDSAVMEALPGKRSADQAHHAPSEFRNAHLLFHHRGHAE